MNRYPFEALRIYGHRRFISFVEAVVVAAGLFPKRPDELMERLPQDPRGHAAIVVALPAPSRGADRGSGADIRSAVVRDVGIAYASAFCTFVLGADSPLPNKFPSPLRKRP